ncbi:nonstructural protein NS2-L [Mouse kidney parvovirus]|uniref:Nonstructural protein NS2-L n=1 Tax=Mouse kidney parvovirus TaxID=2316143 RepID=A0A385GIG7_9VIRU|nr:nonstructural protein NS2-L [Mouse kidney parvovirus]AXX39018.1 nonstructural protein NS2-L [Mouse kidney parvovirus]
MLPGASVLKKKRCLEIECTFSPGLKICMIHHLFAELVNIAANAAFVKQVEAARLVLVGNQLAACRERNNPFQNWFSPNPRQAMFQPDPCLYLEKKHHYLQQKVSGATTSDIAAVQEGSRSNAPTAQDLAAAPAPQLATAYDPVGNTDPAIPEQEYHVPSPGALSVWSPLSLEETMEMISQEIEWENLQAQIARQVAQILADLEENADIAKKWWCWGKPKAKKHGIRFQPPSQAWVGIWAP